MRLPDNGRSPWLVTGMTVVLLSGVLCAFAGGWRTDGTGKYLSATPPTQWSADSNVIWSTPMPGEGNASPVIVGDRLFVCAEPTTLICVSVTDGRILWQRGNAFQDLGQADEADKISADNQRARELKGQLGKLWGELNKLKQALQDKPDDADLKAKQAAAQEQAKKLNEELQPYTKNWYYLPDAHPVNGYSSATPVTDGEHVWVVFGTGIVACYDLEGNRVWWKMLEKPTHGWGHSASPALCGDKLLVHILNLSALDKVTGEVLWQQRVSEGWGSEVIISVGGTDVVVTPRGDFVRVDDGKVLARTGMGLDFNSPVVDGGVVYFIQNGGQAFRMPEAVSGDQMTLRPLWKTEPRKDRYYSSPVVHNGLIYACHQTGIFSVIDAETGKVLYDKALPLGKGTVYPSVTMAGDLLFVSNDSGTTVVLKPGTEYQEVAVNRLEPFRSSPVFVGSRMYVRGLKKLYCIGAAG